MTRKNKKQLQRGAPVWVLILAGLILLGLSTPMPVEEKPLSEAIALLKENEVKQVVVQDNHVNVTLKNGETFVTTKEPDTDFLEVLQNNGIDVTNLEEGYVVKNPSIWPELIPTILSFILPVAILMMFLNKLKGASGDMTAFGKSTARLFKKSKKRITFADVAGNEEAKKEVSEIVDFLKNSNKYRELGARIPKGVLLVGPAGVGKTLMAKAIAGEADVPFYSVSGSEFMEMLVGVGSARVRDLFAKARATQPSLIFIDEIDAIGRQRGMGIGGGHDEREQTLNQILTEMDGFDSRENVIVIAATNRPDMLDPALVRAGRFDRRVVIPMPNLEDREAILKIHAKNKPLAKEIDLKELARKTVGFSGADLENTLNEAAIIAARNGRKKIHREDIEEAILKVTLGPERRTLQTEEEKRMTAYHEAGHAIVTALLPDTDPVVKISIIARGRALGFTSARPERDRYTETKDRLQNQLALLMGGQVAELITKGTVTTGAKADIKEATKLALKMVTEYGMSSLGPVAYNVGNTEQSWLAKQLGEYHVISQATAAEIDKEVKRFIEEGFNTAKNILEEHRDLLEAVADALMEKETLDKEEFEEILKEHGITPQSSDEVK